MEPSWMHLARIIAAVVVVCGLAGVIVYAGVKHFVLDDIDTEELRQFVRRVHDRKPVQ